MSPSDRRYTREHEWARLEGDVVTIGITDFAQQQLGDVVFVELPKVGAHLTATRPFGVVESVKAASDLFSPISGEVTAINSDLESAPEAINHDPFGAGWIIQASASNLQELESLLSSEHYDQFIEGEQSH
ncbi:MAG TPA: glycine cleavage system protein GcvH [Chloroflexota bacterium]|jgi:glycine cleavage system H protein|nr:glycine cleavage system protein GcvH [Chloroflexota bacterium]